MTEIGSKAPAWLAVPSARAGEEPALQDGAAADEHPGRADDGPAVVPGARAGQARGAGPGSGPAGDDGVQGALSPLARLAEAPVSDHVGVFEDVLTGLEAVLASVEEPLQDGER
jgi:hypothetical protein